MLGEKEQKTQTLPNNAVRFLRRRQKVLNGFEIIKIFRTAKLTKGKGPKILSFKQMLKRLTIALAQVQAGNTSENLLNEIRQII